MHEETDVLVIGGGIAGIVSSIEAARAGANVTIACAGPLFGGSSFYPGTWGLGLIGPADEKDEADLIATIENVGCGVAGPALVETFVHNIRPAIEWLEQELGVPLKRPSSAKSAREVTFIPCFDHTNRLWRGIKREAFERVARAEIERLGIELLERCELMEIVRDQHGPVIGAILYDRREQELFPFPAKSVILCSGGTGGLFERSLTSRDVLSSAHGIALDVGCSLVNIEFMQMMPGLVSPARGIVFNEKTFRYAVFEDPAGILPADRKGFPIYLKRAQDTDRSRAVSVMNSSTWQSTPREQRESPSTTTFPKMTRRSSCRRSRNGWKTSLESPPTTSCALRCTRMRQTAVSASTLMPRRAYQDFLHVVKSRAACTAPIESGGSPVQTAWFLDGLPARAPRITAPQHRPVSMQTASSKSHLSASG